jgi:uncharacterized protein with FMN-binding domain
MKRIVLFAMTTLTILVLLFGYHTSTSSRAIAGESSVIAPSVIGSTGTSSAPTTAAPAITVPSTSSGGEGDSDSAAAAGTTSPTTAAASTSSAASSAASTVLGDSVDTRWGPVQVQITVQNGKITAVSVPVFPNNNGRDQEINATALPVLVQETMSAQSAKIDMVSGATVTSDGYLSSLQSALDKAGL